MYHVLNAKSREDKTKVKPHQLRHQGLIPAVLFAGGMKSQSLKLEAKEVKKVLAGHSHVLELLVDGKEKHLVNLEEIQKDPLGGIIHLSFHKLKQNEKTTVTLPISFTGKAKGIKEGGTVVRLLSEADLIGLPGDMPESVTIDVSELGVGDTLILGDCTPPKGLEWGKEDAIKAVASCHLPRSEKEAEPAAQAAPAEGAAAPAAAAAAPKAEGTDKK